MNTAALLGLASSQHRSSAVTALVFERLPGEACLGARMLGRGWRCRQEIILSWTGYRFGESLPQMRGDGLTIGAFRKSKAQSIGANGSCAWRS